MAKANNLVFFDPYKVKLNHKLHDLELKYLLLQLEVNEDKTISNQEKKWKLAQLSKEFKHDKFWTKRMVDLYDNIMKIE